jgi:hypothetical protein
LLISTDFTPPSKVPVPSAKLKNVHIRKKMQI